MQLFDEIASTLSEPVPLWWLYVVLAITAAFEEIFDYFTSRNHKKDKN